MTWVLLQRELLAAARQRGNYWYRAGVAGLGVVGLATLWGQQQLQAFAHRGGMSRPEFAAWALGLMHGALVLVLGVGGAFLTADCLARERRDGTLGLLFLTSLGPGDITLGKCAGQLLRLGACWLSMLPLLAIPLLLGGVTPRNLLDALQAESAALLTGVAAGLLATAYCERWGRALFFAGFWLVAFYASHVVVSGLVLFVHFVLIKGGSFDGYALLALPVMPLLVGVGLPVEGPSGVGASAEMLRVSRWMLGLMAGWSVLLFTTVLLLLYGVLARLREASPSVNARPQRPGNLLGKWVAWVRQIAARPAVRRRTFRPAAGLNPYYWRETRAGGVYCGRWLLVLGVLAVWGVNHWNGLRPGWWLLLAWSLPSWFMAVAVLQAAATFQREREDGGLEVLLCTPLTPAQLLLGRLQAIARGLLPAFILAEACLWWWQPWSRGHRDTFWLVYTAVVVGGGIAAMAVALGAAVRRAHPLTAFLLGLLAGWVVPYGLLWVGLQVIDAIWLRGSWSSPVRLSWIFCVLALGVQSILTIVGWRSAHQALRLRTFHRGRLWQPGGSRSSGATPAESISALQERV